MDDQEGYSIAMDSRWSLEDLYEFPRAFEQVYFAFEAVLPSQDAVASARLTAAFTAFPWRGGYSAVNFYNQLKRATPRERRPTIRAIK